MMKVKDVVATVLKRLEALRRLRQLPGFPTSLLASSGPPPAPTGPPEEAFEDELGFEALGPILPPPRPDTSARTTTLAPLDCQTSAALRQGNRAPHDCQGPEFSEILHLAQVYAERLKVASPSEVQVQAVIHRVFFEREGLVTAALGILTERELALLFLAHLHTTLDPPKSEPVELCEPPWTDEAFLQRVQAAIHPILLHRTLETLGVEH